MSGYWRRNPGRKAAVVGVSVTVAVGGVSLAEAGPSSVKAGPPAASRVAGSALAKDAQAGMARARAALEAGHYGTKLSMRYDTDCAGHSEGRAPDFFRENPCRRMVRGFVQLGELDKDLVLVAISWVEMQDATSAQGYKALVDANAGKVTELSRETKPFEAISFENRTFMTGLKGAFVWNVEVKPQFSTVSDAVVNGILEDSRQG
ncbi:hypothetical protein [Actinomadura gamaensis]|uniref:Uncharacterized protein n=1 Tax=Actinomadura gamaensis TaxID=1763541 RepID=A0ABV9TR91_9ACTN